MGKWRRCAHCNKGLKNHTFMVNGEVWEQAGLKPNEFAHLDCLEDMLGRPLLPADFKDCPLNDMIHIAFRIGSRINE